MRNYIIGALHSQNGIQRDGTFYFSKSYVDGQWVRFYENSPKKIYGCEATSLGNTTIVRSLYSVPQPTNINLYIGRAPATATNNVEYIEVNINGSATAPVDRTPLLSPNPNPTLPPVPFIPNENYVWNFDAGNFTYIGPDQTTQAAANLICANPIINDVSSTFEGGVYIGVVNNATGNPATTPLNLVYDIDNKPVKASGGILYCAPVLIAYGNDGLITWSNIKVPFDIRSGSGTWNTAPDGDVLYVANTKIVKAANTRGSGTPTVLFWSLNSLSRATLTQTGTDTSGSTPTPIYSFVNTIVQDNISIMSANSVVNYEQQFFWIGTDQFYVYNGIVQTLPNTMNNDWFFLNVNLAQRSKVWGVAVPRFKEIWWFYPRGDSTECNACIIYNLELNVWYDNTIPPNQPYNIYPFTRAAGISATGNYPYPIYSDSTLVVNPSNPSLQSYPIWTHEKGLDRKIGGQSFAINSYFTTHLIDLWSNDSTNTNLLDNWRIAPDFLQTGEMSMEVRTRMYPKSAETNYGPYTFTDDTEFIDLSSQGGICNFEFTSNTIGGSYQAGKSLYFYGKGDTLK